MGRAYSWARGVWAWLDDRVGITSLLQPILGHLVPPNTGWRYVLGSATLVAFIVQGVTGIMLATIYVPSAAHAYDSIQFLDSEITMGRLLRGLHYFGASAMMVLMLVHMGRVFLTASYKFPREVNWLAGVVLFVTTIMLAFTGQLLRWDVDAVGSLDVAAQMVGQTPWIGGWLAHQLLGGDSITGLTLSRLFAMHVFFFPGILIAFIALHVYLVFKHGISEPAKPGEPVEPATYRQRYSDLIQKRGVRFWPNVAWRDVVTGMVLVLAILTLAAVFGPRSLSEPPDPTTVYTEPQPDWYFVWYFAIQTAIPSAIEKYIIVAFPIVIVVGLALVPLLANKGERSYRRRPWAVSVAFGAALSIVALTVLGFAAPWRPVFDATLPEDVVSAREGPALQGAMAFEERKCITCHAVDSQGGLYGPDFSSVGEEVPEALMRSRIIKGYEDMPAYGKILTQTEVDELVAFLQSLKDP